MFIDKCKLDINNEIQINFLRIYFHKRTLCTTTEDGGGCQCVNLMTLWEKGFGFPNILFAQTFFFWWGRVINSVLWRCTLAIFAFARLFC